MRLIRHGLHVPLRGPVIQPRIRPTPRALQPEVEELLRIGVARPARSLGTVCNVFGVPKASGETRFVHDLRPVNAVSPSTPFRMEGHREVRALLRRDSWLAKLDLRHAYFHVRVAEESMHKLQFLDADGRRLEFCGMGFGLSTAPRTWTKLLRPVIAWFRSQAVSVVAYLDDILIISCSQEQAVKDVQLVVTTLTDLGFLINRDKSVLTPQRRLEFLGIDVDAPRLLLRATRSKQRGARTLARAALDADSSGRLSLGQLRGFIGLASFVVSTVPGSKSRLANLKTCLRLAVRRSRSRDGWCFLHQRARKELEWWATTSLRGGVSTRQPLPDATISTDASDWAVGVVVRSSLGEFTLSLPLPSGLDGTGSGHRELWALYTGLKEASDRGLLRKGSTVVLTSDSTTALSYVRRSYGRFVHLLALASRLHEIAADLRLVLRTQFVPGAENTLPDALSRYSSKLNEAWIPRTIARDLAHRLGLRMPSTDLFASELRHVCRRFFTWLPTESAAATDALLTPWPRTAWCFPPPALITVVLARFLQQRQTRHLLLLTPEWPSQPWWPSAINLAGGHTIPVRRHLVRGSGSIVASWRCWLISKPRAMESRSTTSRALCV